MILLGHSLLGPKMCHPAMLLITQDGTFPTMARQGHQSSCPTLEGGTNHTVESGPASDEQRAVLLQHG